MVCDTPPSKDVSTHQIWNSYLKEYRRYAPDTKRDGRTLLLLQKLSQRSRLRSQWSKNGTRHSAIQRCIHTPNLEFLPQRIWDICTGHVAGGMDGWTVQLLYASQSSFGGIKIINWPQGYRMFSCSTQLRTKFILLKNVKMPTMVGTLTFLAG